MNGHFTDPSGFWNFWDWGTVWNTMYGSSLYYCLSPNGWSMGTGWCLISNNTISSPQTWEPQRYLQYREQFVDRNSDEDSNGGNEGDEDGDGNILWDDDDLFLWVWPEAFPDSQVQELYLINQNTNIRTLFRWNFWLDPFAPTTETCSWTNTITGWGCIGTIEMLKLSWEDYGFNHSNTAGDASDNDGLIDTWLIHNDFLPDTGDVIAWSNTNNYWQPLFSDKIHVSNVEFFLFPNKDLESSWRDTDPSLRVTPYIQLKMTLKPSWKTKRQIQGDIPGVDISTTIQLSELNFK